MYFGVLMVLRRVPSALQSRMDPERDAEANIFPPGLKTILHASTSFKVFRSLPFMFHSLIPSLLVAETIILPSGLMATLSICLELPGAFAHIKFPSIPQKLTLPPSRAAPRNFPSGLKTKTPILSSPSFQIVLISFPSRLQNLTNPSESPEAIILLSGLNATERIEYSWALRIFRGVPSAFHNRTVVSSEPEAIKRPSGLKATLFTSLVWPLSNLNCFPSMLLNLRAWPLSSSSTNVFPSGLKAL